MYENLSIYSWDNNNFKDLSKIERSILLDWRKNIEDSKKAQSLTNSIEALKANINIKGDELEQLLNTTNADMQKNMR